MILQVHTEKELIEMVESLKKELDELRGYNKNLFKRLNALEIKKPEVQVIKELTTHEIRLDGAIKSQKFK